MSAKCSPLLKYNMGSYQQCLEDSASLQRILWIFLAVGLYPTHISQTHALVAEELITSIYIVNKIKDEIKL